MFFLHKASHYLINHALENQVDSILSSGIYENGYEITLYPQPEVGGFTAMEDKFNLTKN